MTTIGVFTSALSIVGAIGRRNPTGESRAWWFVLIGGDLVSDLTAAVERERQRIRLVDADLADSAVAEVALAMAERIDSGRGSPSECGKVFLQALEQLRALAPVKREKDDLDDLSARRNARLAGRTGTAP